MRMTRKKKNNKPFNTFNFNFKSIQQMQSDGIRTKKSVNVKFRAVIFWTKCAKFLALSLSPSKSFGAVVFFILCFIFSFDFQRTRVWVCACRLAGVSKRRHFWLYRIWSSTMRICILPGGPVDGVQYSLNLLFFFFYFFRLCPTNGRDCFLFQLPIHIQIKFKFFGRSNKTAFWSENGWRMGQSESVNSHSKNKTETQIVVRSVRVWSIRGRWYRDKSQTKPIPNSINFQSKWTVVRVCVRFIKPFITTFMCVQYFFLLLVNSFWFSKLIIIWTLKNYCSIW